MVNDINLVFKEKTQKENRVWVRISEACNNKCLFCLDELAQNGKFISEESVKNQIREWFKIWYFNRIIISWWEASINPKFSEYIKYSKDIWYDRIQTVTNGNMFVSEIFCKKVFSAWLQEVTFSFHWHNPTLHDYLVDTKWAFKKSLKWLIFIKKFYPDIIVNIDIVVNKVNVWFLPEIVKFFMRLWVYEFDILQIIPFWRWFKENKNILFYDINDYKDKLRETWEISKLPWVNMWTNRFPSEAFEWFEDLIQDPRKIKSEVMWEAYDTFNKFILSDWNIKPNCFWDKCSVCFQNQYCHDYISEINLPWKIYSNDFYIVNWEEFPSDVYLKYWKNKLEFFSYLKNIKKPIVNIPKCLWWSWIYQIYNDIKGDKTIDDYTYNYIKNLYRKKSLNCKRCLYDKECKWIHINFIRSYWFNILNPIFKYKW